MNADTMINIVLGDLVNDRIQLEEELERVINENNEVPEKVNNIKSALRKVAINDMMITKWKSYIPATDDNNNRVKEKKDGKV